MRFPDGRHVRPSSTPGTVAVLGAAGHFAGSIGILRRDGTTIVRELITQYGTPDGRVFMAKRDALDVLLDMNREGTLLGYPGIITPSNGPFLFRDGTLIDLHRVVSGVLQPWGPVAINDAGHVVARSLGSGFLLVPAALPAPSGLTFTVIGRVVTLHWQPAPGALEYIVDAGSAPGTSNLHTGSAGAQVSLTTPAPPGRYYVRVRARHANGMSGPSNEVIIDVP